MNDNAHSDFFGFHPLIEEWFLARFGAPTEPQIAGWPLIAKRENVLIAAPTGSGKTLTAFMACIDQLLKRALNNELPDEMSVIYVSPLRALSNDMHRNLSEPLEEIHALAQQKGIDLPKIRVGLRTGDTSSSARASIVRRPPHILVTTPESLYLLLTAEKGRAAIRTTTTLIVDEIHALVRDKRGSHLALSMERLEALTAAHFAAHVRPPAPSLFPNETHEIPPHRLQRIGLSATQRPIERVARFLSGYGDAAITVGSEAADDSSNPTTPPEFEPVESMDSPVENSLPPCAIVDIGHQRQLDLAIEIPPSELGAVCMHEQWDEVMDRMVELINDHRSTLIFVNTRRMSERVTHHLTERLGEDSVGAHHGSLSASIRLETERRLKEGQIKAVVATASLELGIDVGYIDLVVQMGSPRSISAMLQRIGRSGHSLGLVPRGRLFALTRDELIECMALTRSVKRGTLDKVRIPQAPLDILAQHIVSETCGQEWHVDELYDLLRRADPYHKLSREDFDCTLDYLSEGIARTNGRGKVYLHFDRVGRRIRARKGARISAASNGGAIPETGLFRVVSHPDGVVVGSLDEEFAVESSRGDIFLLGNTSWRIMHVRGSDVTVADAQGAPPTIPFWQGEAPGRTLELSSEVSALRAELETRVETPNDAVRWLQEETFCCTRGAEQTVEYVRAQKAAVGLLPTQNRIVFERFFDETGGMQLVVHAPFGAAINRAWGFSMRKRFCVSFDFELQATADDDGFILSLGPQHSFPLESLFPMLTSINAQGLLEQAILTNPIFQVRWRWNVTRALQVDRMRSGKRVPPNLQRFRAEDLLSAVFPALTGCQEEHTGDHILPDHPLARQTMVDCLNETIDIGGLQSVLQRVEAGEFNFIARDTREPSPFSYQLLNANPYAFLDGGEVQERRARAVSTRRSLTVDSVSDLGRLNPDAILQVTREAAPFIRDADELHDALLGRIVLWQSEQQPGWTRWLDELRDAQRITTITRADGVTGIVSAERLAAVRAVYPDAICNPELPNPPGVRTDWQETEGRVSMVRGLLETCGPVTTGEVSQLLSFTHAQTHATMEALEGEGIVLRGRFRNRPADALNHISEPTSAATPDTEWCHRRLLARIHRLTMQGLRAEIQPVSVDVFMRFLLRYHGLVTGTRKQLANGVYETVAMLQGLDIPLAAWEKHVLPARVQDYEPAWLDELCMTGEVGWGRLFPPAKSTVRENGSTASWTKIVPISFWLRSDRNWLLCTQSPPDSITRVSPEAQSIYQLLAERGAIFSMEAAEQLGLNTADFSRAMGELVRSGFATADSLSGLRRLVDDTPQQKNLLRSRNPLLRKRDPASGSGRWSLWRRAADESPGQSEEQPSAGEAIPSAKNLPARSAPATVLSVHNQEDFDKAMEQWAWQLLRRWGVIFKDLLTRESGAPNWFQLLRVYRRLEARGEIRGGRFIAGVAGEQFAAGDVVRQLRDLRETSGDTHPTIVSAADPLNLVGILTDHPRVPSTTNNRVAWLDGIPIAALQSSEVIHFDSTKEYDRAEVEGLLQDSAPTQTRSGSMHLT